MYSKLKKLNLLHVVGTLLKNKNIEIKNNQWKIRE